MKVTRRIFNLSAALSMLGMAAATPALAETAAEFYKGKTIRAISPAGPEATFTIYAQLMAPFIEKYTGARVIVEPMSEGGGYAARNMMSTAEPDGLTIVLVGHGAKLITGSLFQLEGVRYDWRNFTPLARVIDESLLVFIDKESPWQSVTDLQGVTFNYGEGSVFFGPHLAEAMGWKQMRVIPGFRSTAERATAIARGELQATAASKEVIVTYPDLRLLAVSHKQADFPDIPTFHEVAVGDHGKLYADLLEAWVGLLNMSYGPPGLPEDRAAFLEEALRQTWADPEFATALEKVKAKPQQGGFMGREILQSYMDNVAKLTPEEITELKEVVTAKYMAK